MADAPNDDVRAALEKAIGFQYEINRLLGRGGMGAVYQAHEKALDRPVAIKVLPPAVAATGEARERFLREARTAARLTHPNIVPLFTFGEANGLVYYVMGYVEGESLQQQIDRLGKLDAATSARLLGQLAEALEYAHRQGVIHRDVKPDNILIERGTGLAKLTDFGIAKRSAGGETLTGTGLVMGTPRYMSPEQASGDKDIDARSDVYAVGLVGYAMLTGRPPFEAATMQETLRQQVMREAPSLRKVLPDLPTALAGAIEKALQKDPKARHQTAAELAALVKADDDDDSGAIEWRGRKPGLWIAMAAGSAFVTWNLAWFMVWRGGIGGSIFWIAALGPFVGVAVDIAFARWKLTLTRAELRRMLTEPPRSWPFWWPARFRRREDVWPRLPQYVRTSRILFSVGVAVFALFMEGLFLLFSATGKKPLPVGWPRATLSVASMVGTLVPLASLLIAAIRGRIWGKRSGLSELDASRMTTEPTAQPKFWVRPQIARLLSEPVAALSSAPQGIAALVAEIAAAARDLPGHTEAANAARQLASALDALDGEIARLAREFDPAEVGRLEAKLAAPGNEEIKKLYASQLDLLRRLARQQSDLEARRSRYAELLRTLWLQVASLRAQAAADKALDANLSGQVRALCLSVQHEVEAMHETSALLQER